MIQAEVAPNYEDEIQAARAGPTLGPTPARSNSTPVAPSPPDPATPPSPSPPTVSMNQLSRSQRTHFRFSLMLDPGVWRQREIKFGGDISIRMNEVYRYIIKSNLYSACYLCISTLNLSGHVAAREKN